MTRQEFQMELCENFENFAYDLLDNASYDEVKSILDMDWNDVAEEIYGVIYSILREKEKAEREI